MECTTSKRKQLETTKEEKEQKQQKREESLYGNNQDTKIQSTSESTGGFQTSQIEAQAFDPINWNEVECEIIIVFKRKVSELSMDFGQDT